jgi:predicted Zn-dependent protease
VKRFRWLVLLLALAPGLAPRGQNLPDLGERAQSDLSPQAERRIGEQIMREIRRDPDYIDDPEITGYVQSVGYRLVAVSTDSRQEFTFFVVRDKTINAFAMPGGFVGVHSGLIVGAQSESEFAGVLAHEVAHVTQRHLARQLQAQNQLSPIALLGLGLAALAARSSPQLAQGALLASQAAPIAAYLSYSRDFEREADRVGYQMLAAGGYDVAGMPSFFERLQKSTRLYDNNAPAYLRTHPLTSERIADMQNRVQEAPYRQRADPIEFQLVRAKLRATDGKPEDGVAFFRGVLADKRFSEEAPMRYGYAVALARAKQFQAAEREIALVRKGGTPHPMYETLVARIRTGLGDPAGAERILAAAVQAFPDNGAVRLDYAEALQAVGANQQVVELLGYVMSQRGQGARPYRILAQSYASLGRRTDQHRALAEAYFLQGGLAAAVEQLTLAQKAGDADFYTLSAVDARLRELRAQMQEELKAKKEGRLGP